MMTSEVILLYPGRDTKDIAEARELIVEMEIKQIERAAFLSQFFFRNIQQLQLKCGDHLILIELRTTIFTIHLKINSDVQICVCEMFVIFFPKLHFS